MESPNLVIMDTELKSKSHGSRKNIKIGSEDNISNQHLTFLKFISTLLMNSSILPVSRITHRQSKPRKMFWMVTLIVCIFSCCYEAYKFFNVYLQYPVIISVDVQNNTSIDFPAVTICNLNRMKSYHKDCVLENRTWKECRQIASVTRTYFTLVLSERVKYMLNVPNEKEKSYINQAKTFMNHYTNTDADSRRCYGYMLNELIQKCSFNSVPCKESDFTFFQSMQYGNCYTFNKASRSNTPLRNVSKVGSNNGLELELDLNVYSYLDLTQSVGARVVIHSPDEDPNPEDDGINISPGFETHISMIKTSVQRLPAPYRDKCFNYKKDNSVKMRVRSQLDCVRQCIQNLSALLCSCVDPFLPASVTSTRCDLKNATQMLCLDDVLSAISNHQFSCDCPLPCITTTYSLETYSSLLLPDAYSSFLPQFAADKQQKCIYDEILFLNESLMVDEIYLTNFTNRSWIWQDNNTDFYTSFNVPDFSSYNWTKSDGSNVSSMDFDNWTIPVVNSDERYYINTSDTKQTSETFEDTRTKSRVKLQVFYRSLDHTVTTQAAMFAESEIFAHLGGHLGLWLGISLLALFECAENLFLILMFFAKRRKNNECYAGQEICVK
ncbi:acid-sensing ion channel 2-like [Stegodyphus dumicola]|uniref:acid-sensing ion channel 2-like n=1 Tax=Stegodyphus dumicola TaxID=202533 RepID=UPI0015B261E1|nr:acid-sensing ion channel 2-like [Stegodyphus dumicola]